VYEAVINLSDDKKDQIVSEDPASKSNTAAVQEVRAFLRKNLTEMFSEQKDVEVEVIQEPFVDDFLNSMEVACSIRSPTEDGPNMAIGVTFLNKHCFVTDLKPLKDEGPSLVKRSIELKLEIL